MLVGVLHYLHSQFCFRVIFSDDKAPIFNLDCKINCVFPILVARTHIKLKLLVLVLFARLEEQLLIGFVEYEAGRGVELIEEPDLAGHSDDHLEVVRAVLEHLHARVLRVYLRVAEVAKGSYR